MSLKGSIKYVALFAASLFVNGAWAQEVLQLTLKQALEIAKNENPVDLDTVNFPDFKLNRIMEYPVYPNARVAMKAICENFYGEEVK